MRKAPIWSLLWDKNVVLTHSNWKPCLGNAESVDIHLKSIGDLMMNNCPFLEPNDPWSMTVTLSLVMESRTVCYGQSSI